MIQVNKDSLARRISPETSFETELPPEALAELVPPRRPQIRKRPEPAPIGRLPIGRLVFAWLVAVAVIAGGSLWITMPYRERVWATFTGHVPTFADLPPIGNFVGETRVAADTNVPWVWTAPPGGVLQWVDP
jgi:hypothetical protein